MDKLEQELNIEGSLDNPINIIRLNVQEPVGRELAPVYNFEFTPTFIFFDAEGNEMWRTVGVFDPQMVRDSLK